MVPNQPKAFLSRVKALVPGRWLWLLIGVGLVVYSQFIIQQREPRFPVNQELYRWNTTFRLDLVNIQNLAASLPYLLAGILLCALALLPHSWRKDATSLAKFFPFQKLEPAYFWPRFLISIIALGVLFVQLGRHKYASFLPWIWLLALALLTNITWQMDKRSGVSLSLNLASRDFLWMFLLFVIGLFIGSFALKDIPNIMVPDEGMFWEVGRSIARGEYHPAFFDFGVYTFPVASNLFQGWMMRLFGVNLWGWRFASVFAGTIASIPLYLLAREWFDRRVAVIAVLVMLTSPYYLSFARMGYNNSQALFPTVLSLYTFSLAVKRGGWFYPWLTGIAAALGFYTYPAAWLGLMTILLCLLILWFARRMPLRAILLVGVTIALAFSLTAGPRLVYGSSSADNTSLFYKMLETSFFSDFYGRAIFGDTNLITSTINVGQNQILYSPDLYFWLILRGFVRTFASLIDPFLITEHFITTNLAGGFLAAIGLVLGISLSLRGLKQIRFIFLLTWLSAGLFFLSIIAAFPPRHTHLVAIIPAMAILAALGLVALVDSFREIVARFPGIPAQGLGKIALLAGTTTLMFFGLREYFTIMPVRNPPLFEDVVSWLAWRTDKPLNILYVGPTDRVHRVKYHVDTKMISDTYQAIEVKDFTWKNYPQPTVIFLERTEADIPAVFETYPSEFSNFAYYTLPDGQVTGYAWANTDINLKPDLPFTKLPKISVPAILGLILLAVMIFLVRGKIRAEKEENKIGFRVTIEIHLRESIQELPQEESKTQ